MIKTSDGLSLFTNGQQYTVNTTHVNYDKIVAAIVAGKWDAVPGLINTAIAVKQFATKATDVTVDVITGRVTFQGEEVHGSIATRMLDMMREGFDITPLQLFLKNLYDNPSRTAVNELYDFLEYGKNPITSDGHFLAYKRVRHDYKSVHDGKTDNSIGSKPSLPRNKVDDNRDRTCSYGLHFCSHEYLSNFSGDRVVVLKINPRDVVSIPSDYNNTKGRACTYEIIAELSEAEKETAMRKTIWDRPVQDYGTPVGNDDFQGGYEDAVDDFEWGETDWDLYDDIANQTSYARGYRRAIEVEVEDNYNQTVADYRAEYEALEGDTEEDESEDWRSSGCSESEWNSSGCSSDYDAPDEEPAPAPAPAPVPVAASTWPYGAKPNVSPVAQWPFAAKTVPTGSAPAAFDKVQFKAGYDKGYSDGRKKLAQTNNDKSPSYQKGYDQGNRDGRGHKRKAF